MLRSLSSDCVAVEGLLHTMRGTTRSAPKPPFKSSDLASLGGSLSRPPISSPRAWRSKSTATSTSSFSFSSGASGDWNWAAGGGRTSSASTPPSFPTTVGFDTQQQALPALKVGSHHEVATSSLQSNASPGCGEADGFFPRVAMNASETAALRKQPASSGPDEWWAGSAESQMAWQPHLRIARRAPLPSPLASRGDMEEPPVVRRSLTLSEVMASSSTAGHSPPVHAEDQPQPRTKVVVLRPL
ncbi:hypothetical protein ACKKBF_B03830 [Auxenochlorella protothecoides x Auxenochlorella symbiontica]